MTPTPNRMAPTSEAPENQLALNSRTIPAKTNRSSGIDFPLVVTYTSSSTVSKLSFANSRSAAVSV
jgi:hypothetical protein